MKILHNNFNKNNSQPKLEKPKTIKVECDKCGSELEIVEEDTHIGWLGARFVTCPCCGEESMVDELDGITLTPENIQFPTHFTRINKNLKNVKEVKDEEIIDDVKRGILYLRTEKKEFCWYTASGDTFIVVFRYDGDEEYFVMVAKDFYETNIPFEGVDYYNDRF